MENSIKKLLRQIVDVFGKTRFVTSRGVSVKNALVYRFVDEGHRREQKLAARGLIIAGNGCPELLDRSPQFALVAPVDLFALCVLAYALFR